MRTLLQANWGCLILNDHRILFIYLFIIIIYYNLLDSRAQGTRRGAETKRSWRQSRGRTCDPWQGRVSSWRRQSGMQPSQSVVDAKQKRNGISKGNSQTHTRTYTCSIHTHTLYNAFDSFECEKGPEKTGSPYASLFLHLLLLLCFVDVSLNFSSELKFINCAASTHTHTHVYTRISGIPWLQVYVQLPGKKKNLNLK